MRNAVLEEAQAGIKIMGSNIRKLRYADDTTLMAEYEELIVKHLIMCSRHNISKHSTTSVLDGTTAIAVFTLCSLLSWLTQGTQP